MLEHTSGVGRFDFVLSAGLLHLQRDEGDLLGQLDTGAFENCECQFVSCVGTARDERGKGREVRAGTFVCHLYDLAERLCAPEIRDLSEKGGCDAAIFGPEAGAKGFMADPIA